MTRPDEVIYLFSDITETFNTHQALDRSEKILRNIYDNLPAGIELYRQKRFPDRPEYQRYGNFRNR